MVLVPVVVLNHSMGTGQVVHDIPIVDLRIVEMYFEGTLPRFGIVGHDGTVKSGPVINFYDAPEQAGEGIATYFSKPPQYSHMDGVVRSRPIDIHVTKEERLFTIERQEVDGLAILASTLDGEE